MLPVVDSLGRFPDNTSLQPIPRNRGGCETAGSFHGPIRVNAQLCWHKVGQSNLCCLYSVHTDPHLPIVLYSARITKLPMLKTLFSESMMDMSNNPHTKGVDNIPYSLFDGRQSNSLPDSRRRRQMRSCDLCRRGKRACDAVKTIQSCSNCVRKNQACTFNWLKTRSDCQNSRARKRVYSSLQNSGSYTQGYATQCHGCQCEALVEPAADSSRCNSSERGNIRPLSQGKTGQGGYHFNIAPIQDADNGSNDSTLLEGLETAQWSENTCNRSEASFCRSNWKHDGPNALRDTILVQKTSQGFVADGLLRIYNDSMENALSCWLTEHNCPYTMQSYEPSILSATKIKQEWGSSWSNRMYNRVIRLDRAYKSLHIRELTSAEEITVSEALNMSVVAFASQWAQAGERGARCRPTEACLKTGEFPQFNDFERSMQEDLWHRTSQLLLRAASIDSFRVVFALIIFSLTQRPLDVTRPLPRTTDKVRTHYEHFKALLQDDDAPIFLELALRQILAQRRRLERFERDMPRRGDNEPTDPLRREDRDTFNMLYWLGIMFDTLSAAICHRAVVVNDEDCELPQPETLECTESPVVAVSHNILSDHFPVFGHNGHFFANSCSIEGPQEHEVWGGLFTQKRTSQLDHSVTRWPCSYKLAASTLSSAAPVKVLLFRRVAHLETLVSRKAPPTRIEVCKRNCSLQLHAVPFSYGLSSPFLPSFLTHTVRHRRRFPSV